MRWFKRDLFAMAIVAAVLTAVTGCGKTETTADKKDEKKAADKKEGDKKDANKTPAVAATSSPEDTFKAAKAAAEKEDWKGFTATLTPDSRDMFAGMMGLAGVMMQAFAGLGGPDGVEKAKPIGEVLKKHGLTEDAMKKLEDEKPASPEEGMKKLIEPVKDRDQFVADLMGALKGLDDGKKDKSPISKDAEIKDVKIEGDSATATLEFTKDGMKTTEPIAFKKIDGKWLIDMAELMKKEMGGLGGPGGPGDLPGGGNIPGPGDVPPGLGSPSSDAQTEPDASKTTETTENPK